MSTTQVVELIPFKVEFTFRKSARGCINTKTYIRFARTAEEATSSLRKNLHENECWTVIDATATPTSI